MPDLNTPGARVTAIPQTSLASRVAQSVRYVITGVSPNTWFGPMQPLAPMAPPETVGRAFDYPVGYNLNYRPRAYEPTSFTDLKLLADNCDIARIIIESRKDQIEGQEWEVRPRKLADGTHPKASEFAAQIKEAKAFFEYPDKETALPQWLRQVGEEVFVTDATSIYVRPDRKGRIYGFEVIDGATIAPRIDANGRTPKAPDVAYQQILHGIPAADFSTQNLIYLPRNRRPGHVYGYSPIEQIIMTVNTLMRRNMHQLGFYTDGNINDALFTSPEGWTTDQIKQWDAYWNSLFEGNLAARRHGKWVPKGTDVKQLKTPNLKDPFDEYLARIVCFCFKVSPQPFVSMMNRSTADTAHDAAMEEGLSPLLNWYEDLFRRMFDMLGWRDLEMVTQDDREVDAVTQSQIDDADVKAGLRTIDEIRAARGQDPFGGAASRPMVQTATGYVPIDANITDPDDDTTDPTETEGFKTGEPGAAKLAKAIQPVKAPSHWTGAHGHVYFEKVGVKARCCGPRICSDCQDEWVDRFGSPYPGAEKLAKLRGKVTRTLPAIPKGDVAKGANAVIAKRYAKVLRATGKSVGKFVAKSLRKDDDPRQRAQDLSDSVDLDDLAQAGTDTGDDLAAVAAKAGQIQVARIGAGATDASFGSVNAKAAQWASDHAAELVTQIDKATRDMLRELIADDLEAGKSIDEIAADIAEMDAFGEERATLIANVEVANANEAGALQGILAAEEANVVVKKTWLLGPLPCPVCLANAAIGAISPALPFPSGDLAPTAHPRCECALGAEVEESAGAGELDVAA